MVKKYSKRKDGNYHITKNFIVKEFACNDGSDEVLIDDETVNYLQCARDLTNAIIKVSSGYRTPSYNVKVGGASNSYHTKGRACDTYSNLITARKLAKIYECCGANGILWYKTQKFTHVDNRESRYHAINNGGNSWTNVGCFLTASEIAKVQRYLNAVARVTKDPNYKCGKVDKILGASTHKAFMYFCQNAKDKSKIKMLKKLGE